MQCSVCKKRYGIGDFPWCPHGQIKRRPGERWFGFENYIDDHVAPHPVEVTSPGHREQLMKEHNLVVRDREHINDLNHRRWTKGLPPLPR